MKSSTTSWLLVTDGRMELGDDGPTFALGVHTAFQLTLCGITNYA